ncbi:MAG: acyl-ACP desaturase, partial [Acidimicrobiales bacterium]
IYDFGVHHDHIVVPTVFRQWKVTDLEGLSAEGEQARDRLLAYLVRLKRVADRQRDQRGSQLPTRPTS